MTFDDNETFFSENLETNFSEEIDLTTQSFMLDTLPSLPIYKGKLPVILRKLHDQQASRSSISTQLLIQQK